MGLAGLVAAIASVVALKANGYQNALLVVLGTGIVAIQLRPMGPPAMPMSTYDCLHAYIVIGLLIGSGAMIGAAWLSDAFRSPRSTSI